MCRSVTLLPWCWPLGRSVTAISRRISEFGEEFRSWFEISSRHAVDDSQPDSPAVEQAEAEEDPTLHKDLLTFVLVERRDPRVPIELAGAPMAVAREKHTAIRYTGRSDPAICAEIVFLIDI
jgi:hypothetical protein